MRRALVTALLAALACAGTARADATTCAFGGPTGTLRHLRLHLASPASDITLGLQAAAPVPGGTNRASRHLAAGIVVVDLATKRVVAARVSDQGVGPRRTAVIAPGSTPVALDTPGPGLPFGRDNQRPAPGLPAGDYAVVAFGSDGDAAAPNPWWSARLTIAGTHSCTSSGAGRLVDLDATDATSGTAAAAGPALYAAGAGLGAELGGDLVVGSIYAFGGPGGNASVAFRHPSGKGTVSNDIAPFASAPGPFAWRADALGAAAATGVVAAEVRW